MNTYILSKKNTKNTHRVCNPWFRSYHLSFLFVYLMCKAGVVKLVDTLDLGSSGASCGGSNPSARIHELDAL